MKKRRYRANRMGNRIKVEIDLSKEATSLLRTQIGLTNSLITKLLVERHMQNAIEQYNFEADCYIEHQNKMSNDYPVEDEITGIKTPRNTGEEVRYSASWDDEIPY